ncbi:MAG: hypothetical protein JWM34_993 [Ilumatobacteraceae bacterium]|nr:hypothetical protein [Ilumatobacteraceae bacterium]
MSNDQPSRRPPAKSGGGAPMGSTISIVVAVVAVIVGFLILRNISDDSKASGGSTGLPDISVPTGNSTDVSVPTSSDIGGSTTLPAVVTPTTAPITVAGAKVTVANASGVGGAAGLATKALSKLGFTMGDATDAAAAQKKIDTTVVYYLTGGELVAASVAQLYSTADHVITAAAMPAAIPVKGASIGDSTVLVLLGTDLAGKAIPAIAVTTTVPATTLPSATISTATTLAP